MQGTISLGDTTMTFVIGEEQDQPNLLAVQDGLSGQMEQSAPSRDAIFAALAVALLGDQYELPEEILELAESVQPKAKELRFIP